MKRRAQASLEKMVEGAIARAYEYMAITDHTRSLRIASGLSIDALQDQHRLIDKLNQKYAPFRVLRSAEVDILASGELDYPDEVLGQFDIVTASIQYMNEPGTPRRTVNYERLLLPWKTTSGEVLVTSCAKIVSQECDTIPGPDDNSVSRKSARSSLASLAEV